MTTTEKIRHERNKIQEKLSYLKLIEDDQTLLETLKHNHKETESKELEIHVLWERYEEL